MSPFERVARRIASRLVDLTSECAAAWYAACAESLRIEYLGWAAARSLSVDPVLDEAIAAAYEFAQTGSRPQTLEMLLAQLKAGPTGLVDGDWGSELVSTGAQDCWICAESALGLVRGQTDPVDAVWFALEPMMQSTTQRLFGAASLGTHDRDTGEMLALCDPLMARAVEFCDWSTHYLRGKPRVAGADLALLRERASVLCPD